MMEPTWAELREAVRWSKSNYRHCGDYGSVRIGARVYLDGLCITKLETEIERLKLAEYAISKIGELLILMSTYDWFWRHTRRVLDEYHKDKEKVSVAAKDSPE